MYANNQDYEQRKSIELFATIMDLFGFCQFYVINCISELVYLWTYAYSASYRSITSVLSSNVSLFIQNVNLKIFVWEMNVSVLDNICVGNKRVCAVLDNINMCVKWMCAWQNVCVSWMYIAQDIWYYYYCFFHTQANGVAYNIMTIYSLNCAWQQTIILHSINSTYTVLH